MQPATHSDDLRSTIGFVCNQLGVWRGSGLLGADDATFLFSHYESVGAALEKGAAAPVALADRLPPSRLAKDPQKQDLLDELRRLVFLRREIAAHHAAGLVTLVFLHRSQSEISSRIAFLRSRLGGELAAGFETAEQVSTHTLSEMKPFLREQAGLEPSQTKSPDSVPATDRIYVEPKKQPPTAVSASKLPRNLLEILLDPRNIQYLMILTGGVFVIGLVVWLWALGVFENKLIVASALGVTNVGVLAAGCAMVMLTRYQTAGRAIALLACVVMPLNLWFYDAQGLVDLEQGGHLWIPAVGCCALYFVTAYVLRDPAFVPALVGGMALTGLLILADHDVQRFWEIATPSALLVVIGLIGIHVERAFPDEEGPFTRRRFGMAFFWSGHAVMATGLLLLLFGQLAGWLYGPYLQSWGLLLRPAIVEDFPLRLLALALVIAATYVYVYSDIVVRHVGWYLNLAVVTLLWGEVLALDLFAMRIGEETVIIALSLTALLVNVLQANVLPGEASDRMKSLGAFGVRAGLPLGWILCTVPVLLGLHLHLRATYHHLNQLWPYTMAWEFVAAMATAAVSCRISAHMHRHIDARTVTVYFFGTATATLLAGSGALHICGFQTWDIIAPCLMPIPIVYMAATRLYRGGPAERPLAVTAHAATLVMIVSVVFAALRLAPAHVVEAIRGEELNLRLAVFFAEATAFYLLAAALRGQGFNLYLATATASAAVWQLLYFFRVSDNVYVLTFAGLGLALLAGYRFAFMDRFKVSGLAGAAFQCGNTLLSLSGVAAILLSLSELLGAVKFAQLFVLLVVIAMTLVGAALVHDARWRRGYIVSAIAQGFVGFLILNQLSDLSFWQKLEIFCVSAGLLMLVIGHVGWYREAERYSDVVSLSLFLGSLLVALPLSIEVVLQRGGWQRTFSWFGILNEVGMLGAWLGMLATGVTFRIRSTTIFGACMAVVYVLSFALFVDVPEKLQTVGAMMAIGGGLGFAAVVLLSVYRDRLLSLPERIAKREGMFQVLSWR